jgi:CubicO group peptidase (beta-lactamase class C family)
MRTKIVVLSIVLVLVAALGLAAIIEREYIEEIPLACAFKAKTLCAGLFLQGLPLERLVAEDSGFDPAFALVHARVDTTARRVTCSLLGTGLFAKTAVLIDGLGPVLLSGVSEKELRAMAASVEPRLMAAASTDKAWPAGDADPAPPSAGATAAKAVGGPLKAADLGPLLDAAFAEPDPAHPRRTRAVVVIQGGRMVAERYAPGISRDTRLISWSMAKSFTNAMVGILVGEGKLDIHAPAPVAEWSGPGDPRRSITTDMLMRMSSGLDWEEDYTDHPISDSNRMLFLERDMAAYTARKPLASTPDTVWKYSSGSTNLVSRIVKTTMGDGGRYLSFPYSRLFGRIGMRSAVFGTDAAGTFVGSSYIYATARDYARFGLLLLHDGVWEGERILPAGWVAYSTTPTKAAPKGEYGAFFWLNKGEPAGSTNRDYPDMPDDLFWCDGYQGQYIVVCPSLDLVVVRLGMTWKGDDGVAALLSGIRQAMGR